ncbi:MAG: YebC/PmpR family DNA-binding transcriptional regulator [Gemmatimonadetes bacterium]|nr:YebC/PmpR family DNA-binding transcriptional regulator [Gemmatimonadota bacterium]
MSGHSKWSTIRRKKEKVDAARGRIFTRLIKDITSAARQGGGDPEGNPRLRLAIQSAKAANMPADNIERAIKKGTGELDGQVIEEVIYEGYTPGGAALMLEVATDNRNRTAAAVRHLFSKHNGSLGSSGCVSWLFEKRGVILVDAAEVDEDRLMEVALEAGAEDLTSEESTHQVLTTVDSCDEIRAALEGAGIPMVSAEVTRLPSTTKRLEGSEAIQAVRLIGLLEDLDDVERVYSNADVDESVIENA